MDTLVSPIQDKRIYKNGCKRFRQDLLVLLSSSHHNPPTNTAFTLACLNAGRSSRWS